MSRFTEMGKKPRKSGKYISTILTVLYILPILISFSSALYYKLTGQIAPERYGLIYFYIDILPYILLFFLVVMIILRILRYIKAFFKRKSFVKNLKKICKEREYKIEIRQNPYKSIFISSSEPAILVYTKEKVYAVYFFTALRRDSALKFYDENYAEFWHYIMKQMPPLRRGKYYSLSDITIENNDLPVEKILLVNPAPFQIYKGSSKGSEVVDNNEKMFGYTLYAGTGFCNMIDRLHLKAEPIRINRYNYV